MNVSCRDALPSQVSRHVSQYDTQEIQIELRTQAEALL